LNGQQAFRQLGGKMSHLIYLLNPKLFYSLLSIWGEERASFP
jgi:hypothetical protein